MKITIKQLSDRQISVNGKLIVKDMNDNWVANAPLTELEQELSSRMINSIENGTAKEV